MSNTYNTESSAKFLTYETNFMATIRSTAIFAGLSIMLWNKNYRFFTAMVLLICVVLHLVNTYVFYLRALKYKKHWTLPVISPVIQSLLLSLVLSLLMYRAAGELWKKYKKK